MPRSAETTRLCALTREEKPVDELIRFAVGPDDAIVPDVDARAEGRGVWVTLGRTKIDEAVRKKAFARSLKEQVKVPDDLGALTQKRLEQRLLSALSMARKAGQLLTGGTKVKSAIDAGDIIALITASDAADDGRDKMISALRGFDRAVGNEAETPQLQMLTSEQLGLALGLENVIHAALTKGAAAQSALARGLRLARYTAN
jgi:predicted RNA-binding protein YlxR (DUF448 family)